MAERPRAGGTGKLAVRRRRRNNNDPRAFGEAPRNQSMSRGSWGWTESKTSIDFLSPLDGFLRKNCGRPWDEVYSEFRERLNSPMAQKYVCDHLWRFVEKNVVLNDDGVPCVRERDWKPGSKSRRWKLVPLGVRYAWQQYFIHPTSGLLLRVPGPKPQPSTVPARPRGWRALPAVDARGNTECVVQGRDAYVKHAGVWYRVDMRPVPEDCPWGSRARHVRARVFGGRTTYQDDYGPLDVLLGIRLAVDHDAHDRVAQWHAARARDLYGCLGYYAHARGAQVNTKTLRRLGVQNDPVVEQVS